MQTKRITKATFKSFIRKNADRLYVRTSWEFNSIDDGYHSSVDYGFTPAAVRVLNNDPMDLEVVGVKLAHDRNFFLPFNDKGLVGYAVINFYGKFIVAIPA